MTQVSQPFNVRETELNAKTQQKMAKLVTRQKKTTGQHSVSYIDNATERILSICKCLQSFMTVNNIGTQKQQKVSEA